MPVFDAVPLVARGGGPGRKVGADLIEDAGGPVRCPVGVADTAAPRNDFSQRRSVTNLAQESRVPVYVGTAKT